MAEAPPLVNTSAAPAVGSAIADLSYRRYDGPRHTRAIRWWIVAVASLRLASKNRIFWIVVGLAVLPYLFAGMVLLLQPMIGMNGGGPFGGAEHPKRALTFYQAFSNQGFFVFLAALILGAGSIAADNRTNALQVYLAKPLTKGDYLLGKWMGLFLPLFAMALAPALLLYSFCLVTFAHEGFLRDDPTLILRIVGACAVPGLIYSSVLIGLSAWCKRPAVAGVLFAALYFLSAVVVNIAWVIRYRDHLDQGVLLHALSLGGLINGLAQNIYAVTLQNTFFHRRAMEVIQISLPPPSWGVLLAVASALIVAGILAARTRVRAVEVVRG